MFHYRTFYENGAPGFSGLQPIQQTGSTIFAGTWKVWTTLLSSTWVWSQHCLVRDRFFDPSSREGLRLVSGTPQRTMEPLKIATGLLPWEILAIAEEDFNLGGVIQHHLGGLFAFALQRTLLQFGPHLEMGVFFQFFQLRTNTRDNSLADTCTSNFQIQSGGWDNRWSGGVKRASLVQYVVCHVPSSTHSSW